MSVVEIAGSCAQGCLFNHVHSSGKQPFVTSSIFHHKSMKLTKKRKRGDVAEHLIA